jgi:hypothetical protein
MKNPIILIVLVCWACAKPDLEAEKKSIKQLIDNESKYAAAADSLKWANCWVNTNDAQFTYVSVDGAQQYKGWRVIRSGFKGAKPFELKLTRDNYNFTIGNDVAFVSFDQQDNWGGMEERKTKETRTLKKIDGEWKIVDINVIAVSSFEKPITGSFHVAKEKIAVDPRTSFHNQSGLGGMAVAYWEAPAGTDFSPLLAGLPQDMCTSPHWGYVVEGSLRVKYPDGKEEVIKGGEVFYLPAPHTGIVEKNIKFIDFSPEPQFAQVMDHIAKKFAEQKQK